MYIVWRNQNTVTVKYVQEHNASTTRTMIRLDTLHTETNVLNEPLATMLFDIQDHAYP